MTALDISRRLPPASGESVSGICGICLSARWKALVGGETAAGVSPVTSVRQARYVRRVHTCEKVAVIRLKRLCQALWDGVSGVLKV